METLEAIGFSKKIVTNIHLSILLCIYKYIHITQAYQVVLVVKKPPANAGDISDANSIPVLGRSPGGGHANPLEHSCLENAHEQRSLSATVYRVTKSQTFLKELSMYAHITLQR